MPNIVDYVRTASQPFSAKPLNRVDSLVFSWLAYYPLPIGASAARTSQGMRLAELCDPDWLVEMVSQLHEPGESLELIGVAAASPRFSGVRVCNYVTETSGVDQTQFSAMTFLIPDVGAYVAFRGTDGSLAGWKEDFNMAFSPQVPAQRKAREYLEKVVDGLAGTAGLERAAFPEATAALERAASSEATTTPEGAETAAPVLPSDARLWVGGHSKGGNLAVFASMTADARTRARIERVFSHDGPGFNPEVLASPSWTGDASLVDKTVPVDSFVGLVFGRRAAPGVTVVRCDGEGIMQHSPLSWLAQGDDFVIEPSVSYAAMRQARRFNEWVLSMDAPARERFVDTLYHLVRRMGVRNIGDISRDWQSFASQLLSSVDGLDPASRAEFSEALEDLAASMLLGPASDYDRSDLTPVQSAERGAVRVEESGARFYDIMRDLERRTGVKL